MIKRHLLASICAVATAGSPALAQADISKEAGAVEESSTGLRDIVVTARRRAEPLQQTPLAVSAIDSVRLDEANVSQLADMTSLAPSLYLSRDTVVSSRLLAFIRGFGNKSSDPAAEPAVALTIDGVYQASQIGTFINLFDVEAVEVLRGPQGTLLGKNAPAGGLSIRTRRPSMNFGGMAQVDYGSYGDFQVRSYIDVPIAEDRLAATISYFRERSDGYIRNRVTGNRRGGIFTQSMRLGILAKPNDDLTWYISSQYDTDKGEDPGPRNITTRDPLVIPTADYSGTAAPISTTCRSPFSSALCAPGGILPNLDRYTTDATEVPRRNHRNFSVTSDLNMEAGAVSLASVTGYRKFQERANQDIDGTPLDILNFDSGPAGLFGNYRQFSQEFRVASTEGGGLDMNNRLRWLLGAYYLWFDYDRSRYQTALGGDGQDNQKQTSNSFALFGHVEFDVTDAFIISAGARQTWDRKDHESCSASCFRGSDVLVSQRDSWKNFSIDATAEYHLSRDKMLFVRYAEGYRGGGFAGVPATARLASTVGSETVKSYEAGIKADFWDRRARLNITGFKADYSGLQRAISQATTFPPFYVQIPRNIAAATTEGFEVEAQLRPIPALTLRGSVGYIDAHYTSYRGDLTGAANNAVTDNSALKFPYISKWTGSAGFTYRADLGSAGTLAFVGDYAYRSRYNTTDQTYAFADQPGFGLISGSITWKDASDTFMLSVYGKNLADKYYIEEADAVGGLTTFVSEGAPRTFGISAGVKF